MLELIAPALLLFGIARDSVQTIRGEAAFDREQMVIDRYVDNRTNKALEEQIRSELCNEEKRMEYSKRLYTFKRANPVYSTYRKETGIDKINGGDIKYCGLSTDQLVNLILQSYNFHWYSTRVATEMAHKEYNKFLEDEKRRKSRRRRW